MERVFIGAISGMHSSQPRILTSARAILDFIFLAHLPIHTSTSLSRLQHVLDIFHDNKDVFVVLGIRPHFNIPKVHWLFHYPPAIANLGPCDGLSTDISERLHIDYCKLGYRASNRREYIQQMIVWLTRREKVRHMESYLRWYLASTGDPLQQCMPPCTSDGWDVIGSNTNHPAAMSELDEPSTVAHPSSTSHETISTTVFTAGNASSTYASSGDRHMEPDGNDDDSDPEVRYLSQQ